MKKLVGIVLVISILILASNAAFAQVLEVTKLTDMYALRENGELVKFRDTKDNQTERVMLDVIDFNNSCYITKDGALYDMSGKCLANDAQKVVTTAIYVDGKYNGEYAYLTKDGTLKMPKTEGYEEAVLCENVKETIGNIVLTNDQKVYALVKDTSISLKAEYLVDNIMEIHGRNGEYLLLSKDAKCYFVPLLNGEYKYDYKVLLLDENIMLCKTIDTVVTLDNRWLKYSEANLKKGIGGGTVKHTGVLLAAGTNMYTATNNALLCSYMDEANYLHGNFRTVTQYNSESMAGYALDQADTLFRQEQNDNNLKSIEVAYPMVEISLTGDGWCIAKDQFGIVYGVDKAVGFGTGLIDEQSGVTQIELGINYKTTYVNLNGERVALTRRIIESGGRTLYPFRELCELMNASVSYDDETKTATAVLDGNTVSFTPNTATYTLNGETKNMDVAAKNDKLTSSMYVPLRYFAEGLGYKVLWQSNKYENIIDIVK